jgi:DNA uptake protein ComE-like DNA-binding protein
MKTFLSGFAIGAGIGMLVAPKPGRELRRQLRTRGRSSPPKEPKGEEITSPPDNNRENQTALGGRSLNSVSREELLSVYGIGPVLADRIIQNRPYRDAHEVVERGILPESTFAELERDLLRRAI